MDEDTELTVLKLIPYAYSISIRNHRFLCYGGPCYCK